MILLAQFTRVTAFLSVILFVGLGGIAEVYLKPGGLDLFDARFFGYGPQEARDYIFALDASGNTDVYLAQFRLLDTAFPLLLAATFTGVIWLNTAARVRAIRLALLLAPLAYLWADLRENAAVAQMLRAGEGVTDALVGTASTMTQLKWACVALSVAFMLGAWAMGRRLEGVKE